MDTPSYHSSPHCRKPSVHQLIGFSYFWPHQNTIYCSHLYQHCIRNLHLTDTRVSSLFSFELPEEPSLPCIRSKTGFLLFTFLVIWPLCITSSKAAPVKGSISKLVAWMRNVRHRLTCVNTSSNSWCSGRFYNLQEMKPHWLNYWPGSGFFRVYNMILAVGSLIIFLYLANPICVRRWSCDLWASWSSCLFPCLTHYLGLE